jgi:hypothetical protein
VDQVTVPMALGSQGSLTSQVPTSSLLCPPLKAAGMELKGGVGQRHSLMSRGRPQLSKQAPKALLPPE